MTREEICVKIKETVSRALTNVKVEVRVYYKNNGNNYIGVAFNRTEEGINISPVMNISDLVEKIISQSLDIDQASEQVIRAYKSNKVEYNYTPNRKDILENVFCEVINYEANKESLQKRPHIRYLDLAITFRYNVSIGEINGSIALTNQMLEKFNCSMEEIQKLAFDKLDNEEFEVIDICQFLSEKYDYYDVFDMLDIIPIFVVLCKDRSYGARALIAKDLLKRFDCNMLIIPSSIHELILIPDIDIDLDYVKEMIKQINENEVDPKEFLSNSLYGYDCENDEILIIK